MDNVRLRFSSLESLQHSHLDLNEVQAQGKIAVGGKTYQVQTAADGKMSVELAEKSKGFFSAVKNRLGSDGASSSKQTMREQIEQTLNGRRTIGNAAAGPSLARSGGGRFGTTQLNVGWINAIANKPENNAKALSSMQDLAKRMFEANRAFGGHALLEDIYHAYANDVLQSRPMSDQQKKDYFSTLKTLNRQGEVEIWPQRLDGVHKNFSLSQFIRENPRAGTEHYRVARPGAQLVDDGRFQARMTFNVKPEYASSLAKVLTQFVKENEQVQAGKLMGPDRIGQRAETGILYLGGDAKSNQGLATRLQAFLPHDSWIDRQPMGMHAFGKGIYYAETAPGDDTSHGNSRAKIIYHALHGDASIPLNDRLKTAIVNAGYHPENPAFRHDSEW